MRKGYAYFNFTTFPYAGIIRIRCLEILRLEAAALTFLFPMGIISARFCVIKTRHPLLMRQSYKNFTGNINYNVKWLSI